MMRISVFGLGYVGCVTAACLARAGHAVVGVDISAEKVALINAGRSPIVEPGLHELLSEVVSADRLRAVTSSEAALAESDVALICVGTPARPNGQLDVDALTRVGEQIGRGLTRRRARYTVVLRSTVLPGTTEGVFIPALARGLGGALPAGVGVAVNPEFLREGTALADFARPPLTLIGSNDPEAAALLASLYNGMDAPLVATTIASAEMVKYAANSFHALKVCFANEIGDACAALGADAQEVMRIFRMDRKLNISEAYLRPGFAFGGSCLPKDLRALLHAAGRADLVLPLLGAILPSNESQVRRAVETVLSKRKRRVGIVGLAFKPGTDDLRESPMVALAEALIGKGCDVRILDGNVALARLVGANRRYIAEEIPHISALMCRSVEEMLAHAQVIVVGAAGVEAAEILENAAPGQVVVDLTRGEAARHRSKAWAEVG